MDFETIRDMELDELMNWLYDNFFIAIPISIETQEEIKYAQMLSLKASNFYAYLAVLNAKAKIWIRESKPDKEEHGKAIDRQYAINSYLDLVEQQYKAISRAFSMRAERLAEARMIDGAVYRESE